MGFVQIFFIQVQFLILAYILCVFLSIAFKALLKMSQPIEFSSSVQPMCIASSKMNGNTTYESASVTIAGWGNIKEELDIGK